MKAGAKKVTKKNHLYKEETLARSEAKLWLWNKSRTHTGTRQGRRRLYEHMGEGGTGGQRGIRPVTQGRAIDLK